MNNRKPLKENQAENILTPIKGESSVLFVPVMTAERNQRREKTVITRTWKMEKRGTAQDESQG